MFASRLRFKKLGLSQENRIVDESSFLLEAKLRGYVYFGYTVNIAYKILAKSDVKNFVALFKV